MAKNQVTVVVHIKSKPGMESRVKHELFQLLAPTRAEAGCINYDMHEAPNDPSLFLFHENWTSQEALNRHFQTEHIQRWIQKAESLLAEPMALTLWRRVDER